VAADLRRRVAVGLRKKLDDEMAAMVRDEGQTMLGSVVI
jgi:hypothetical protein